MSVSYKDKASEGLDLESDYCIVNEQAQVRPMDAVVAKAAMPSDNLHCLKSPFPMRFLSLSFSRQLCPT